MVRSSLTLGHVLLAVSVPRPLAQGLPIGTVVTPDDCVEVGGGELHVQHLDGAYDDWMSHALAKGGAAGRSRPR